MRCASVSLLLGESVVGGGDVHLEAKCGDEDCAEENVVSSEDEADV